MAAGAGEVVDEEEVVACLEEGVPAQVVSQNLPGGKRRLIEIYAALCLCLNTLGSLVPFFLHTKRHHCGYANGVYKRYIKAMVHLK